MQVGAQKTAYVLSMLIILLAGFATLGGLFLKGLYRDSDFYKTGWLGNDLVTLLLILPLMVLSIYKTRSGSLRGHLVWMGLLSYMLYNYAFYLFGAAFNWFFPVYVSLFSLSVAALIAGLWGFDVRHLKIDLTQKASLKWISAFLLFLSLPLILVELGQWGNFVLSGKVPEVPSLIFALDLSIIVPGSVLGSILLWKKQPWGVVLSAIMLVKGFTYGVVLCFSTALIALTSTGGQWDPLMPFYVFVAIGSLTCLLLLLRSIRPFLQHSNT